METWLSLCWFQCIQCDIAIDTDIQDFEPAWQGNSTLMELFLRASFWEAELVTMNQCQICMLSFSLISAMDQGMAIEPEFRNCLKIADNYQYHWLQSHPPSATEWLLWQHGLTQSLNLSQMRILPIPLGKWVNHVQEMSSWFMDPEGEHLYHQNHHEWTTYTPIPCQSQTKSFHASPCPLPQESIPQNLVRAMLYNYGSIFTITGMTLSNRTSLHHLRFMPIASGLAASANKNHRES